MSRGEKRRTVRSRLSVAIVLGGVLCANLDLAAQSKKGLEAMAAGDYEQAVILFKAEAQRGNEKDRFSKYYYLGLAHFQSKQLPEAIASFEESLKHTEKARSWVLFSFGPACHLALGQAYLDNEQYQEAAIHFAEAARISLQYSTGKKLSSLRDLSPAFKESFIKTAARGYSFLGEACSRNGADLEAMDAHKKAIEISPEDGAVYSYLALTYIRSKQYDDALAAARRGMELAANSQVSYVNLGDVHAARKEYDLAIDAYRKAVEVAPLQLADYKKTAGTYFSQTTYDQMRRAADIATAGVYVKASQVSVAKGDYAGAIDAINRAAELAPKNSATFYQLGAVYAQLGKFDQAVTALDKAIGMETAGSKKAAPYLGIRSLVHREKGDREGATADAGQAFALNPEAEFVREAQAAVSLDDGRYEEAIRLLSSLKDRPLARVLEATARAKRNDFSRAIAVYSAIPEDDASANSALAQSALGSLKQALKGHVQERLEKAGASESLGRFVEAMTEYAEAAKMADETTASSIRQRVAALLKANPYLAEIPEDVRKLALGGDVLIKDGRFDDALGEYRAALELAPFNPQLHFNAALIHGQLKDYRRAIEHMTIYLQLNPDAPNARAAKDEIYKWEFSLKDALKK
jgi:tetratricopeptide (TPR) repeat protein